MPADPAPLLSLDQAVAMRDACVALPDTVAFTAGTMLYLLESYIRILKQREREQELWDGTWNWPRA